MAGGAFTMGHAPTESVWVDAGFPVVLRPRNDWSPSHEVTLSPFFIDRTEVTWTDFAQCLKASVCAAEGIAASPSTRAAPNDAALGNRPAASIHYAEAAAYCDWRGKRLPTEAEWERAARGPESRDYPWGDAKPIEALLAAPRWYDARPGGRAPPPVGTNPQDVSAEGAHDLFGSVAEWVSDWYGPYPAEPETNPAGPLEPPAAKDRVIRGGNSASFVGLDYDPRGPPAWQRDEATSWIGSSGLGFRCARDDRPWSREANCPRGSCPQALATGEDRPHGLRVDARHAYWTNVGGTVRQLDVDGGPALTLATSREPRGLSVDADFVYWVDSSDGTLARVPIDGGQVAILAAGLSRPYDLQLWGSSAYWGEADQADGGGAVASLRLDAGARSTLAQAQPWPLALAVGSAGVFWATALYPWAGGGTIASVPLTGGTPRVLAGGVTTSFGLVVSSTHAYWTDYWAGTVSSAPLEGGGPTVLARGQLGPHGIAVDDLHLYWTNAGDNGGNDGSVMKLPLDGGPPEALARFQHGARGLAVDATSVWWVTRGGLLRLTPK